MANILVNDKVHVSASFDAGSTGTTLEWVPGEVCDVYRIGFIPTTEAVTGAPVIGIVKRDVVGTGSTVIDTWPVGLVAVGGFGYHDIVIPVAQSTGIDGSLIDVDPAGPIHLVPGQSLFFTVPTAGTTGTGLLVIYYWADGIAEAEGLDTTIKS